MAFLVAGLGIEQLKGWLRWGNREFLVPVCVWVSVSTRLMSVLSSLTSEISEPGKFAKAAVLVDLG